MRKNVELKRQMTDVSELMETTRVDINMTSSRMRAETFQEKTSVFIVIGRERSVKENLEGGRDTLSGIPKGEIFAQQSNKNRCEQSEHIDGRHDMDEVEKFVDDDNCSGEKLEDFVSLKECKRFNIYDTDDPLQTYNILYPNPISTHTSSQSSVDAMAEPITHPLSRIGARRCYRI